MMEGLKNEQEEFLKADKRNNVIIGEESMVKGYGLSLNALVESYAHNTSKIKKKIVREGVW